MREGRVKFEGSFVLPTRVHIVLAAVAHRLECLIAEAAGFFASGSLNFCDGLSQLLLATGPGVKTGEQEQLHVTSVESARQGVLTPAPLQRCSGWLRHAMPPDLALGAGLAHELRFQHAVENHARQRIAGLSC